MAFCSSCGHEIGEGTAFCPACGAKVSAPATPVFDEEDIKENKLIAVFAYLNVLVLVPILAGRKSPFARYHAPSRGWYCSLSRRSCTSHTAL